MTGVLAMVETSLARFGLTPVLAAHRLGLEVVLLSSSAQRYLGYGPARQVFDECGVEVRPVDTADVDAVLDALADLRPRLRGVLSVTDYNVHVAAAAARRLGLPGLSPHAAAAARDKSAARRECVRAGVAVPGHAWVRTEAQVRIAVEEVGLPCVVKPLTESGSVGVVLCRTLAQAVAAWRAVDAVRTDYRGRPRPPGALVEEYLLGYECSVETVADDAGRHVVGVTDKLLGAHPHFVEVGQNFPSVLPEAVRADCVALAHAALDAVGHDFGAAHVEMRVTDEGPRLVEINPRLPGGMITDLVRHSLGVDLVAAVVALHTGQPADLAPTRAAGAAERQLVSPADGVLRAVHGADLARRVPGVVELELEAEPGERISAARSNVDYLGHLLAVGGSAGEAARRADTALGQLVVEVDRR
ncbi:ATP-grasp domain-containing protein [Catellatospora sp. KI3]|uniref:ATP-grasp domain-containing protein n=1 Tax=Catellatospora sp. KI3 TaxID=3041620 RepID=UPI002482C552|nr:ATP-grasp domain-containing protein [Catellatospora sp. KI3]MDI1463740.1 ATP-grasp domain-containing protein [Catellatospora sp. KI3]